MPEPKRCSCCEKHTLRAQEEKKKLLNRLRRIEGQVRGLLLGYITNASLDETGVAKYATLEPSCDLSKLEQIAIITEYNVQ